MATPLHAQSADLCASAPPVPRRLTFSPASPQAAVPAGGTSSPRTASAAAGAPAASPPLPASAELTSALSSFLSLHHELDLLRTYVTHNALGFWKLLKAYDKKTGANFRNVM
jgi:hypothetical protein